MVLSACTTTSSYSCPRFYRKAGRSLRDAQGRLFAQPVLSTSEGLRMTVAAAWRLATYNLYPANVPGPVLRNSIPAMSSTA